MYNQKKICLYLIVYLSFTQNVTDITSFMLSILLYIIQMLSAEKTVYRERANFSRIIIIIIIITMQFLFQYNCIFFTVQFF